MIFTITHTAVKLANCDPHLLCPLFNILSRIDLSYKTICGLCAQYTNTGLHRGIHTYSTHTQRHSCRISFRGFSTVPEKFAQTSQTKSHLNLQIINFFVILISISPSPVSLHLSLFFSLYTRIIVFPLQPCFSPPGKAE